MSTEEGVWTTESIMRALAYDQGEKWSEDKLKNLRVLCKDGFSVSIQAGRYWSSRDSLDRAWIANSEFSPTLPWKSFDVGLPSEDISEIIGYEDPDWFYFFVPYEKVVQILEAHGGAVGWTEKWQYGD